MDREPKRVVVTRSEPSDGPLSSQLRDLGLAVLLWPAVAVELAEPGPLEAALGCAGSFDWIVFASRHAVAAVTRIMPTAPAGVRIAAVGQATAQVLRQRGWPVDLLPAEANAAALVDAFAAEDAAADTNEANGVPGTDGRRGTDGTHGTDRITDTNRIRGTSRIPGTSPTGTGTDSIPDANGTRSTGRIPATPATDGTTGRTSGSHGIPRTDRAKEFEGAAARRVKNIRGARILFPASSRALPTISTGLTQLGAEVVQVEAYRTESSASLDVENCRSWIARGSIGAVTFASPSAVDELEHALGKDDFDRLLGAAAAVAIGPTTARALTDRGHTPALAQEPTLQGLAHTTHRLLQQNEAGPR